MKETVASYQLLKTLKLTQKIHANFNIKKALANLFKWQSNYIKIEIDSNSYTYRDSIYKAMEIL